MVARTIGCLFLIFSSAGALVIFNSSQVYDEFDFKGTKDIIIDCHELCAIFASVTSESDKFAKNLLIQQPKGFTSVSEVAARIDPITKQKAPFIVRSAALKIVNGNTQLAAGPLVLYVVKGAEAEDPVADVFEADGLTIENVPKALTVMSARPFTLHQEARQGTGAQVPEGVLATMSGYDGLGVDGRFTCWPLFLKIAQPNRFHGMHLEVNGPVVSVGYYGHDYGVPLPPLSASIGITNKLDLDKSGWLGSPGAHACPGKPLYRSSLYDMKAPIHAEISSDKPVVFRAQYSTSSEGLRLTDTDSGTVTSVDINAPGTPGNLPVRKTHNVTVDWTPKGSDGEYFILVWNNKQE